MCGWCPGSSGSAVECLENNTRIVESSGEESGLSSSRLALPSDTSDTNASQDEQTFSVATSIDPHRSETGGYICEGGGWVRENARLLAFPSPVLPLRPTLLYRCSGINVSLPIIIRHSKRPLDTSGRHSETHQGSHGMCYLQKTQDQGVSDTLPRHARNLSIHHPFIPFHSVMKPIHRVGIASSMELVATSPS